MSAGHHFKSGAIHGAVSAAGDAALPVTPRGTGRLRAITIGVLSLALLWLIVTHTLVAYLADAAPEWALRLTPNDPEALLNVAEARLIKITAGQDAPAAAVGGQESSIPSFANPALNRIFSKRLAETAGEEAVVPQAGAEQAKLSGEALTAELGEIRKLAERALAADPISARAVRILGQIAEAAGDEERAAGLMREAARRSRHETVAVYSMMMRSFAAKDYTATLDYADALLRTRQGLQATAYALLSRMAELPEATGLLAQRLATNPPWRGEFIANMPLGISDARTPLSVFQALKATGAPPGNEELATYLRFLVGRNFHELAYYTWLQFLPPDRLASARLVFNGSFENTPSGQIFDWIITQGSNVTVEISTRHDAEDNRGLHVEFGTGRVHLGTVAQRLMLPNGPYVLKYSYRGEVAGRRGLKWKLSCVAGSSGQLAETQMFIGVQRSWRVIETAFEVPEGCKSQELRLVHDSRSTSEEYASGSVWYDDIEIVRASTQLGQPAQE